MRQPVDQGAGRGRSGLGQPALRLRLSTVLVFVLFTVIGIRLVALQFTDGKAYAARGLKDRLISVKIPAHRGSILDRYGAPLAQSVQARYVYADPSMIKNPVAAADKLFPLLGTVGVTRSQLIEKMTKRNRADGTPVLFEYLARGIDVSLGNAVAALGIDGVVVQPDERRDVPGHDLAANLIGITNPDNMSGLVGLEQAYDGTLAGVNGERTFETGLDNEIPSGYHEEKPARPGTSVQLTIDRDLQFRIQQMLAESMGPAKAKFAAAVVLDVHNGDVLAQASFPTFDAANPVSAQGANMTDAAAGMTVDPGSIAKVIALGGALNEHLITPDTPIPWTPTIERGGYTYRDTHWNLPTGTRLTLPGILAYSSNVCTIKVAGELGPQKLYDYQRKFGLGQATGEGLPGEATGLVQPPANWSPSSAGSIPIGMGISATTLQMAAVYAAIANDGVWVRPRLIQGTVPPSGKPKAAGPSATRRVLSGTAAAQLRTALEAVLTVPDATGRSAQVPGYRVAGKTGTGQLVQNGHYAPGEVASFIGMAPADAPRYVIAVLAYTPGGNGGAVAGPAFSDMMSFTLRHFAVPPTGTKPPTFKVTG